MGRGIRRARTLLEDEEGSALTRPKLARRVNFGRVSDLKYWLRTEHGKLWGPYTLAAVERLRGQLTDKAEASLDGKVFRPAAELPELLPFLTASREPAPQRPVGPRISPALMQAFKVSATPIARSDAPDAAAAREAEPARSAPARDATSPRAAPPREAAPSPRVITPPHVEPVPPAEPARPAPAAALASKPPEPADATTLPESGSLEERSPLRLYALAAASSASGWLQLNLEGGRMLQISFRRGTPEHLSTDDPDHSLLRFLQSQSVVSPEQGRKAEEQATKTGQDLVSVLFQLQLIPPANAHRLLGDYSLHLLDRALLSWRGTFAFESDAPPPPGAFPLGQRWTLLAEAVRRLDPVPLRARLGKRLLLPVQRSGGMSIGRIEELALNAQEARVYASIDGTRTGEELLRHQDAQVALRMLYLLTELGHLAFGEAPVAAPVPRDSEPPAPSTPPSAAPPSGGPASAPPPPKEHAKVPVRELPKVVRPPPPGSAAGQGARSMPPPSVARSVPPPSVARAAPAPAPATKPPPPAAKTSPPPSSAPTPAFAAQPPGETPEDAVVRLRALLARLSKADHFAALGLDRKTVTSAEVKRNFFALAKELHPDTVTDSSQTELHDLKQALFGRINEASQVLTDDARRKAYEQELDGKASNVDVGRIFAAEENFQRAEIMIKARKYQEGLSLLEEAIRLNADEAEFYAWRGYAKFLLSKDRKAAYPDTAADCRKAIKLIPVCVPAHLFLGHMAKVVGDAKLAQQCYQRVLELEPKHVEAQRELRLMGKK